MKKIAHVTDNTDLFSKSPVLFHQKHDWAFKIRMQAMPYWAVESARYTRYAQAMALLAFIFLLSILYGYGHKLLTQYGY